MTIRFCKVEHFCHLVSQKLKNEIAKEDYFINMPNALYSVSVIKLQLHYTCTLPSSAKSFTAYTYKHYLFVNNQNKKCVLIRSYMSFRSYGFKAH
jgi:hypothetical protein